MSKIQNVFEKISKSLELIASFKKSESPEELYELFKKIDPEITKAEIEADLQRLAVDEIRSGEVDDEELEFVAGGKIDFNTAKAKAISMYLSDPDKEHGGF